MVVVAVAVTATAAEAVKLVVVVGSNKHKVSQWCIVEKKDNSEPLSNCGNRYVPVFCMIYWKHFFREIQNSVIYFMMLCE